MKQFIAGVMVWGGLAGVAAGQSTPWVVPFAGTAADEVGQPLTGPLPTTFAVYAEPVGGEPLWVEVQVVAADAQGDYTALLGDSTDGLPARLFASGEARWLGTQIEGHAESVRTQLLSVPYAMKAADAETVGGLPASAFLLADAVSGSAPSGLAAPATAGDDAAGEGGGGPQPLITGNETIRNSLCVGGDCLAVEVFGFETIKLKENNLRLLFEDTSTTPGSFPSVDWQITANDSGSGGKNKFAIDEITTGRTLFTLEAFGPSNALYVDSDGDLGLGTNNPAVDVHAVDGNTPTLRLEQDGSNGFTPQTWDVAGNETNFFIRDVTGGSRLPFRIRPGAPTSAIEIRDTGNVRFGDNGGEIGEPTNGELGFFTGGTERMRITSTGAVGIGTATPPGAVKLDVIGVIRAGQGSAGNPGFIFNEGGGTSEDTGIYGPNDNELAFSTNGNERLRINDSGQVLIGATSPLGAHRLEITGTAGCTACGGSFAVISDLRLKSEVKDLENALDVVARLRAVGFQYSDEFRTSRSGIPSARQYGFIAQEFQEVFPNAVTAGPDGLLQMNSSSVVPYLVAAMQELTETIESQRDQIRALTETQRLLTDRLDALGGVSAP